jgi:hypothetical protein
MSIRPLLVAILGPTATGKSALALALADRYHGEIINCDSTAVYRGFDIGTDKVPLDQRRGIPHHMIDTVDPTVEYSAAQYAKDAAALVRDIHQRGRLPLVVGGTGLYYRALTRGLFPGPGKDEGCESGGGNCGSTRRGIVASMAAARGRRVGRPYSAARSEADCSRAGSLLPHRSSFDQAF